VDLRLRGRRALVTGASAGIGRAVVRALAVEGCNVAFCARRAEPLAELAAQVSGTAGRRAVPVVADMTRPADVERFIAEAADALGGIDILVNNAATSTLGTISEVSDEQWSYDLDVKLLGYVRACRAALPHLRAAGGGRILNVTGNAARQPIAQQMSGGAATAAVLNFTVALAAQVAADGIHVIAVAPGPVLTPRVEAQAQALAQRLGVTVQEAVGRMGRELPLGRIPEAAEIAGIVAFLASERAAYMTGTTVTVDGGISRGI
jgi:3-oxoacyl-[acyl-carrier protein] reductase